MRERERERIFKYMFVIIRQMTLLAHGFLDLAAAHRRRVLQERSSGGSSAVHRIPFLLGKRNIRRRIVVDEFQKRRPMFTVLLHQCDEKREIIVFDFRCVCERSHPSRCSDRWLLAIVATALLFRAWAFVFKVKTMVDTPWGTGGDGFAVL